VTDHPFALIATVLSIAWALWYLLRTASGPAGADEDGEQVPAPVVVDRTRRGGDDDGIDVTS
jgi:hypothetical protein